MAEIKEITILDFVDWCKQQVDLAELSALMTDFGYADDSSDTIANALEDEEFRAEFRALLQRSLAQPKSYHEQQRADGELTADDWVEILRAKTNGGASPLTNGLTWDDGLKILVNVVDEVLNPVPKETEAQKAARLKAAEDAKKSATFTWIIVAVVIIAVVSILLLATRKK